ncbi:MAG: hypothetical protein WDN04_21605 [Rhodospirillales bacterium]
MLAELIDLGMQLARAAAARALIDLAKPAAPASDEPASLEAEPPPDPPEKSPSKPPASERPPDGAPATPRRATLRSLASLKPIDPAQLYIRLTTAICACIALQTRLTKTRPPPKPPSTPQSAPTPGARPSAKASASSPSKTPIKSCCSAKPASASTKN